MCTGLYEDFLDFDLDFDLDVDFDSMFILS